MLAESAGPLDADLTAWLDAQSPHGVVYVCMGTLGVLTEIELRSVALGLAQLKQRVLWKMSAADMPGVLVLAPAAC